MNLKFIRKGIIITSLIGAVLIPIQNIAAASGTSILNKQESVTNIDQNYLLNAVVEIQKQDNTKKEIKILSSEEIKLNKWLLGKVFVTCENGVAYVYTNPTEESDIAGKVYDATSVMVTEKGDTWSEVQSGNVVGYVKTENLVLGQDAIDKAKEILTAAYPDKDLFSLTSEEIDKAFSVGETKEEEVARLAAEEAARIAAEQERIAAQRAASLSKGQEIVSFAKQFIGNPYVWGGTSLTNGADCSGFVQSVYKHFGVSLPRTSYSMEHVGREVSYSEIQPGDIVCYEGHVGIYAGNGQLVNAINEAKGIGMSNATYRPILTIRRIF